MDQGEYFFKAMIVLQQEPPIEQVPEYVLRLLRGNWNSQSEKTSVGCIEKGSLSWKRFNGCIVYARR